MTASHTRKIEKSATGLGAQPWVLFGLDEHGKPRAAYFAAKDAALAKKAAGLMGLTAKPVAGSQQLEIAAKLPPGRIYSSGRGLVPNVPPKLYDTLMQALGDGAQAGQSPPPAEPPPNGSSPLRGPSKPSKGPPLPANWQDIAVGHRVIAQEEDLKDGWWQFHVAAQSGDSFTLAWIGFPRMKKIVRHRLNLALRYPSDDAADAIARSRDVKPPEATGEAHITPASATSRYPKDWQAIGVGDLVLAQEDGPMAQWWEAIPVSAEGDVFRLRWRDYPNMPTIIRHRLSLALLCPDANGSKRG